MGITSYVHRKYYENAVKRLHEPVFIVGCGHSGTSILQRVIGANSIFYSVVDESMLFYKSYRDKASLINKWLSESNKCGKKRIIEKTPSHIYRLSEIFQQTQGAKILHMVRDGRDVACSYKQRSTFEDGIENWVKSTAAIKSYLGNKSVLIVKLEEFIIDPKKSLEEIMTFIGGEFEQEMLEYHKQPAYYYDSEIRKPLSAQDGENHRALRNWQINQPLFKTTSRWKLEMTDEEKQLFKQKAQSQLMFWGYETSDRW